jgi:RNA polymerase sigma-70 factor (sigma-E family)
MQRDRARDEFERFVAETTDDLLRTAYLVLWDLAGAEDLVQECLFRVARRWPRVRSMEHPAAYARRIVVNLALDGAERRRRHNAELDGPDPGRVEERPDEAAARALGTVESASELLAVLGTLAPLQRAVLALRFYDDLSEAQVAEILGCSVGTVKSTAWRALERLRTVLVPVPVGQGTRHPRTGSDTADTADTADRQGVNDDEPAP